MSAPKKSLGQNFLMHPQIAERIVSVSGVGSNDTVLEIGPGTGMLTRELLKKVKKVIAVEADDELVPELAETFAQEIEEGRLVLIHEDIRTFKVEEYVSGPYAVVANIPYYITGEIIRTFLSAEHKPSSMTILVQKEVAERIARLDPKKPKESILSLSVKVFGTPKYCFTVPRGAFRPAPNVDSAVLSIQNIDSRTFKTPKDEEFFFTLLKAGFAHKRKRLAKNLEGLFSFNIVEETLAKSELQKDVRPEDLTLSNWLTLASSFAKTAKK